MPDPPPPPVRIGSPLDDVNDAFHEAYDAARERAADDAPVFVLLGDALVVRRGAARREYAVTPPAYHAIKSAAHAPVALFAALHPLGDAPLDGEASARVSALRDRARAALGALDADAAEPDVAADARALLEATISLAGRTLADGRTTRADREAFARGAGAALLRLADHAAGVQLAALHARAEEAMAVLTPREREGFHVVVAGAHQARDRSLGVQYFRKRLGDAPGVEGRVAYAENVADEEGALALVSTRRLDREIAGAFFGDPRRLQRDVLGDAAKARLDALEFERG